MVGIIYKSPFQNNLLKILNKNFPSNDMDVTEICKNNKYIFHENNTVCTKFASADDKKYNQFCTMHNLQQLIQCPTHVTRHTSTLTDQILASFPSRVSQEGVINVGLSDHQLIFVQKKFLN